MEVETMIDAAALQFAGITPPPPGKHRTTCPKCSHTRKKPWQRCLLITPHSWGMEVSCFHCDYRDGIV